MTKTRLRTRSVSRVATATLIGSVLALWTPACTTVELHPVEISDQAVLLTVPTVPQDELYECGLASVSALSEYYALPIGSAEASQLAAIAARDEGLSGAELRSALERAGFEVFIFPGTLDREVSGIYSHVDHGRPLLVMISVHDGSHHYALVTGYDPLHENVFLLDPRRGSIVLPALAFDALWTKSNRFTLLAIPATAPQISPVTPPPPRASP